MEKCSDATVRRLGGKALHDRTHGALGVRIALRYQAGEPPTQIAKLADTRVDEAQLGGGSSRVAPHERRVCRVIRLLISASMNPIAPARLMIRWSPNTGGGRTAGPTLRRLGGRLKLGAAMAARLAGRAA
jgi:hypothetical protein